MNQFVSELEAFSNNNNYIGDLTTEDDDLIVSIGLWDGSERAVRFVNYRGLKDKQSSGFRIGDICIMSRTSFLDEIVNDTVNDTGTLAEMPKLRSFLFKGVGTDTVYLEIIAENAVVM